MPTEPTRPDPDPRDRPRARRGFAAMDPRRLQELASLGGRKVHEKGTAHSFTSEAARLAARKRHGSGPVPQAKS